MPHIDISMMSGRSDETKKKVAEAVVGAMMDSLGCERSHLSVAIHDFDASDWNESVHDKVDTSKLYAGEVYEVK